MTTLFTYLKILWNVLRYRQLPKWNPETRTWQISVARGQDRIVRPARIHHYEFQVGLNSYSHYRSLCLKLLAFDNSIVIDALQRALEPPGKRMEYVFAFVWYPSEKTIGELESILYDDKKIKYVSVNPHYVDALVTHEVYLAKKDI